MRSYRGASSLLTVGLSNKFAGITVVTLDERKVTYFA